MDTCEPTNNAAERARLLLLGQGGIAHEPIEQPQPRRVAIDATQAPPAPPVRIEVVVEDRPSFISIEIPKELMIDGVEQDGLRYKTILDEAAVEAEKGVRAALAAAWPDSQAREIDRRRQRLAEAEAVLAQAQADLSRAEADAQQAAERHRQAAVEGAAVEAVRQLWAAVVAARAQAQAARTDAGVEGLQVWVDSLRTELTRLEDEEAAGLKRYRQDSLAAALASAQAQLPLLKQELVEVVRLPVLNLALAQAKVVALLRQQNRARLGI